MFRKVCLLFIIACFVLTALPGDVMADRKRLLKPSEKAKAESKPINVSPSKHMLAGCLVGGKLTGKITDYVDETKDQIVYGFGVGYEYYLKPKIGLGAELRMMWMGTPKENITNIKSTEYRAFVLFRLQPEAAKTVYLKLGFGKAKGSGAVFDNQVSSSRTQLKLGLGLLSYSTGKSNTRIELSFNRMFHPDDEDIYSSVRFPYSLDYIALDVGFGISL